MTSLTYASIVLIIKLKHVSIATLALSRKWGKRSTARNPHADSIHHPPDQTNNAGVVEADMAVKYEGRAQQAGILGRKGVAWHAGSTEDSCNGVLAI